MFSHLIKSNICAEILKLLFNGEERNYNIREIEKISSSKYAGIAKELNKLINLDLVKIQKHNGINHYSANNNLIYYDDLVNLLAKTIINKKEIINNLWNRPVTFSFFSCLINSKNKSNDMNLIIMENISNTDTLKTVSIILEKIPLKIPIHTYTESEFQNLLTQQDKLAINILNSKKDWLIGDQKNFEEIFTYTLT